MSRSPSMRFLYMSTILSGPLLAQQAQITVSELNLVTILSPVPREDVIAGVMMQLFTVVVD